MDKSDFIKWAKKLQQTYISNDRVRAELAQVELVAVVGPTGVGKTTIIERLDLPVVLSDVTRPMRAGEKKERGYHFRDDYLQVLQDIKQGEYVQFLINSTDEFYGTRRNAYPDQGLCSMAVYAEVVNQFKTLGFKKIHLFYVMPPGYVEWMRRVGTHNTNDLQRRLEEAKISMNIALKDESFNFILNDSVDFAVRDIKIVLEGGKPDEHRSGLAHETAGILLERIGDTDTDF